MFNEYLSIATPFSFVKQGSHIHVLSAFFLEIKVPVHSIYEKLITRECCLHLVLLPCRVYPPPTCKKSHLCRTWISVVIIFHDTHTHTHARSQTYGKISNELLKFIMKHFITSSFHKNRIQYNYFKLHEMYFCLKQSS
jgi:hypothetical protein